MYHTVAYYNGALGTTANTDIAAVNDGIITLQNNHILPPMDMMLIAGYFQSATLNRARISTPRLRQITQPQMRPITQGTSPPNNPNFAWYWKNAIKLKGLEEISVQATAAPATTEPFWAFLFLEQMRTPVPAGDPITLRATSTGTATANIWSQIAYTLDDQLPTGTYAMIGSEVVSTTGICHRWTYDGQYLRPGALSNTAVQNRSADPFYSGLWGEWGRFRNTSQPRLEVFCSAADASHTIMLQVIQVSTALQ